MEPRKAAKNASAAAALPLRSGVRAAEARLHAKVDVIKVLDRIAAALAALEADAGAPKHTPGVTSGEQATRKQPVRLRHNWG